MKHFSASTALALSTNKALKVRVFSMDAAFDPFAPPDDLVVPAGPFLFLLPGPPSCSLILLILSASDRFEAPPFVDAAFLAFKPSKKLDELEEDFSCWFCARRLAFEKVLGGIVGSGDADFICMSSLLDCTCVL